MITHSEGKPPKASRSAVNGLTKKQNSGTSVSQFVDHRTEAIAQRKLWDMANDRPQVRQLIAVPTGAEPLEDTGPTHNAGIVQKATYDDMDTMWETEFKNETWLHTDDGDLWKNYNEAAEQLPYVDFLNTKDADPHVDPNVVREDGRVTIRFDRTNPKKWDPDFYVAAIIHELIHVANKRKYEKHSDADETGLAYANFHLPEPEGDERENGLAPNQVASIREQLKIFGQNWEDLYNTLESDNKKGLFSESVFAHLKDRIQYGGGKAIEETDTVIFDISFYLAKKELTETATYNFAKRMLKEATDRRNTPGQKVRRVDAQAYWFQIWKW